MGIDSFLLGNHKTSGHGVGKINDVGAEIARQDADKIIDAVRSAKRFYEANAFLLIAGATGGPGSGSMPIMARTLNEQFKDKPVYVLVFLPFEHEEKTEARTFYNSATCIKAAKRGLRSALFFIRKTVGVLGFTPTQYAKNQ